MRKNVHACNLQLEDTSGFPKLPPNASPCKKLARHLRNQLAPNPDSFKCREFFRNKSSQTAEQKRYAKSRYFYMIHPFSNLNAFIENVFIISWFYSIVADPLEIFATGTTLKLIEEYLVLIIQRTVIVMFFFIGYVDNTTKEIIIEPRRVIVRYLTAYFLVDITATKILTRTLNVLIFHVSGTRPESEYTFYICEHVGQMSCYTLRLQTLINYLQVTMKRMKIPKSVQILATHTIKTFIIIHIFACFFYTIPNALYRKEWPEETWFYQANIHPGSGASILRKYVECVLVIVCHFFGARYGKYNITVPSEQLLLSIATLFGRLYTLFLLADVLKNFGIARVSQSSYEQQLTHLEAYMASRNLPSALRKRLLKFYEYKLKKHYFNEPQILSTLSEHLKIEMFLFDARNLFKKVAIFRCLPKATLGTIVASMKKQTFSPRDVIIAPNTYVEDVFFIFSGTIAIRTPEGMELCHYEDGDEFGLVATLTGYQQKYIVEAAEPTEVFYINRDLFMRFIADFPEAVRRFEESTRKRASMLQALENSIRKGGTDFLSELRSGYVLETFNKRPSVQE